MRCWNVWVGGWVDRRMAYRSPRPSLGNRDSPEEGQGAEDLGGWVAGWVGGCGVGWVEEEEKADTSACPPPPQ